MKVIIIQPNIPVYRIAFYKMLYARYQESFEVWYSNDNYGNVTNAGNAEIWAKGLGPLISITPWLDFQMGALSVPVTRKDIVVLSGGPRTITNILLLLKCRTIGAKTVWWGHYKSSTTRTWRLKLRMLIARLSNALLFYNQYEFDEYIHEYLQDKHKQVAYLNNTLNTENIQEFRKPYKLVAREKSIVCIGRLVKKSNIRLLLEVIAELNDNTILHLIGDGPEYDALVEITREYKLSKRVLFHGSLMDEFEISKVFNESSIFVFPGSVGLSLVHAMAYGVPSIIHDNVTRHGPEARMHKSGRTGLTFTEGSRSSLKEAIQNARIAPLALYSANSRDLIDKHFRIDQMAGRFTALIDKL